MGAVEPVQAADTQTCGPLPASTLEIYDIKAPALDERIVEMPTLKRAPGSNYVSSFHGGVLTTHDVVVFFEISHRVINVATGVFCDAPNLVRIGMGFTHRIAYLPRSVALDPCIRAAVRSYEAAHISADEEALDQFLDGKQGHVAAVMRRLKQMPAPSPRVAIARWQTGLRAALTEAKLRFVDEEQSISAGVDTAGALQLLDACGGKLRRP
jgi:hypothetical protein